MIKKALLLNDKAKLFLAIKLSKMKTSKLLLFFCFGIVVGILISCGLLILYSNSTSTTYVTLGKDAILDNNSILKKGTEIRVDEGMSEGFTRYILYLNAKHLEGSIAKKDTINIIKPYWIR